MLYSSSIMSGCPRDRSTFRRSVLTLLSFVLLVAPSSAPAQPVVGPQALQITSHADGISVVRKILPLRGTITAPEPLRMVLDVLYADGTRDRKRIQPYGGAFSVYCVLKPGVNELVVKAIDGNDGRHRADVAVTYNPPASALAEDERALTIDQPTADAVIASPVLKVVGTVTGFTDGALVYVQLQSSAGTKSKQVTLSGGAFSAYFVLVDQYNTLDVRCGDLVETRMFQCSAPKGFKPADTGTDVPGATGPSTPDKTEFPAAPERAPAPVPVALPDVQVTVPAQDALVMSPVLRVAGVVRSAAIRSVRVVVVNEQVSAESVTDVVDGGFSKYVVLTTPVPVVRVEGLTADGTRVAEDVIEFKCGRPKDWSGPLPWEYRNDVADDPGAASGRPPVAAPTRPRPDGAASTAPTTTTTAPQGQMSWDIVLVPIVLFVMLPVIIVRGQFIMNKLANKATSMAKNRPVACEFCRAKAMRYHLFSLPGDDVGREILTGFCDCASLTSNDEVNEQLKPWLDKAHELAKGQPPAEPLELACVWCRECKSGFLVVPKDDGEQRLPILAPVYFDWLLVSCGLHG